MKAFSPQTLTDPLHILLIEDDEGDRDLALEYLKADRSNLYQVTWAKSLESGLDKLKNGQFDAIILDLVLPDSRGVTTVSKLCAQAQGIPVIVSSYFDENALANKVIELGAQDYLAKDLMDSQSLGRTMSRALARAKHQAEQLAAHLSGQRSHREKENRMAQSSAAESLRSQPNPLTAKIQQLQADIQRLESVANDVNQLAGEKQALDEARQRMVTTLSHECRSPATVILLATNILKSYDPKIEDAQYLATITRIDEAVRQMMHLLDSAMTFKRAQSLVKVTQPTRFNLQALCQQTIAKLNKQFSPKPDFKVEYIGDCTNVFLYKEAAECVLVQLLTNAIQYVRQIEEQTEDQGEGQSKAQSEDPQTSDVSRSSPIEITIQNHPQNITLQIKDQGCGIPTGELTKVFEAFYRSSHVNNIHGLGLGLTMVKTCVEMCGGQVSLESQQDQGTTVMVTLPELS